MSKTPATCMKCKAILDRAECETDSGYCDWCKPAQELERLLPKPGAILIPCTACEGRGIFNAATGYAPEGDADDVYCLCPLGRELAQGEAVSMS